MMSLLAMFIALNFKVYGLTKVNNDHLLTYMNVISTIISSFGSIFWGILLDKIKYKSLLKIVVFLAGFFGATLPIAANYIVTFFIWYIALGVFERGIFAVMGPTLVQIFGLKMGCQLLPLKLTALFAALILVPVFQAIVLKYLTFDIVIVIIGLSLASMVYWVNKLEDLYYW